LKDHRSLDAAWLSGTCVAVEELSGLKNYCCFIQRLGFVLVLKPEAKISLRCAVTRETWRKWFTLLLVVDSA